MSARQLRRLLLIALLGIAQCVFLLSYVFVIHSIEVEGTVLVPREAIISCSSLRTGDYYWSYWLLGLPQQVRQLPQLNTASVRFCPGGKVIISVKEQPAVAQIATGNSLSPWVGVTAEGTVLGPVNAANCRLPKIRLFRGTGSAGRVPLLPMERFLQVQETCERVLGQDIAEYQFDDSYALTVTVKLLGRETPILIGDCRNFSSKDKALYALMVTLRKEGKPIKRIDVRFNNPVVALLNPPKTEKNAETDNPQPTETEAGQNAEGESVPEETEPAVPAESAAAAPEETPQTAAEPSSPAGTEANGAQAESSAPEPIADNNGDSRPESAPVSVPQVSEPEAQSRDEVSSGVPAEENVQPTPYEGPAVEEPTAEE